MSTGRRTALFVLLVVVCGIAGIVRAERAPTVRRSHTAEPKSPPEPRRSPRSRAPHVVFSNTTYGSDYGKVEVARADPDDPHAVTPLSCARVDVTAGAGICLSVDQGSSRPTAEDLRRQLRRAAHLPTPRASEPSPHVARRALRRDDGVRVRDSYAASTYSTRTIFVDARTGEILGHLEEFDVTNNGKSVDAINRNYWGVTFAPTRTPSTRHSASATTSS
jgi:hypothetical protein